MALKSSMRERKKRIAHHTTNGSTLSGLLSTALQECAERTARSKTRRCSPGIRLHVLASTWHVSVQTAIVLAHLLAITTCVVGYASRATCRFVSFGTLCGEAF
jgi:hypothetical protein